LPKIYIPTGSADDWRRLLADPEKHWQTGYSAKSLACCWESATGLPTEIASMLRPYGRDPELLLAIPEYPVPLPGGGHASQNDLFALARAGDMTFEITIEGKVSEPFGPTVQEWLQEDRIGAPPASHGKHECLSFIRTLLGLPHLNDTRYQLLHRSASAVLEARRFKTDAAAMIVHSFSPEKVGFDAFAEFASLFDVTVDTNELVAVRPSARAPLCPPLYLGWACGDCSFLDA
jgi:hypothetical protein